MVSLISEPASKSSLVRRVISIADGTTYAGICAGFSEDVPCRLMLTIIEIGAGCANADTFCFSMTAIGEDPEIGFCVEEKPLQHRLTVWEGGSGSASFR